MGLKKEDIYIDLKGKSKEELTDLYELFKGELTTEEIYINIQAYRFLTGDGYAFYNKPNKTEVTIEQLKEIIKPDLQTKLENAKKEVERIEKLIEEENKPKVGDWCKLWEDDKSNACIGKLRYINHDGQYKYQTSETMFLHCEKITNPELIKLLEDESK